MLTPENPADLTAKPGAVAPIKLYQVGGADSAGKAQPFRVDSDGRMLVMLKPGTVVDATIKNLAEVYTPAHVDALELIAAVAGTTNAVNLASSAELISLDQLRAAMGLVAKEATQAEVLAKLEAIRLILAAGLAVRNDAQIKARAGQLVSLSSGQVSALININTSLLSIANPAGSGKTIYLGLISPQTTSSTTIYRVRTPTIGGSPTTIASSFLGIAGATARTGGTVPVQGSTGSGTLEFSSANQIDPSAPATVSIAPGQSLAWTMQPTLLASGMVSVQAWSEAA